MRRRSISPYGFFLLPVIATLLLLFAAASISLQRAMRIQMTARDSERASRLGSDDLQLQKTAAVQLASELVEIIQERPVDAQRQISIDAQNGNWSLKGNVFGDLSPLLKVDAWNPSIPAHEEIDLPAHIRSVIGNQPRLLGRKVQLPYQRRADLEDPLRPRLSGRSSTDLRELTIYEIPGQSAIAGRRVKIGNQPIEGSVAVRDLELGSDASIGGSLTVWNRLRMEAGARVSGKTASAAFDSLVDSQLVRKLETGALTGGSRVRNGEISVIRSNEWAAWLDLGDRHSNSEGICSLLLPASSPTLWDAYTLPYYECETKIFATWENDSTVRVRMVSGTAATLSERLAQSGGGSDFVLGRNTPGHAGISYRQAASGERLLAIDMAVFGGRTLYVDFVSTGGQRLANRLFVTLRNARDISRLGGFSLVTPNRVLLHREVNTVHPIPLSMFAAEFRYGYGHMAAQLAFDGQLGSVGDGENFEPDRHPTSGQTQAAVQSLHLADISQPARLPPIVLKSWLIVAENPE